MTFSEEGWNFADIWERWADEIPDNEAQVQEGRRFDWSAFSGRADGVALSLIKGASRGEKVALYLRNCPEYLESMFACFKGSLVPVNVNYRYTAEELESLWTDADVTAVVFHGSFLETCESVRGRLKAVRTWIWVDDGREGCPPWAEPYEPAAASATVRTVPSWGRSPDDIVLLYTGGTTGAPKGVMWRQDDLIVNFSATTPHLLPPVPGWDAIDAGRVESGRRILAAAPLMHGTGGFSAMWHLCRGGSVVTMTPGRFDASVLLDCVSRMRIWGVSIVGDAFAKPVVQALEQEPGRWDISTLRMMVSSGVMWSAETKAALLRHSARLTLVDTFGSSEAIGLAAQVSATSNDVSPTARFRLGTSTRVIDDQGKEVRPGSGERGRIALRGRIPLGYYNDPVKSAETFIVIDGERWSIPGDIAEVQSDGTLKLHGRGSQCINSGGEKIFVEEVEEALKRCAGVVDAAVVGLPDDRFGEKVVALVESEDTAQFDPEGSISQLRGILAAYKIPREFVCVDSLSRGPNGKLDYVAMRAVALAAERDGSILIGT